jgi:hypothetical protein
MDSSIELPAILSVVSSMSLPALMKVKVCLGDMHCIDLTEGNDGKVLTTFYFYGKTIIPTPRKPQAIRCFRISVLFHDRPIQPKLFLQEVKGNKCDISKPGLMSVDSLLD